MEGLPILVGWVISGNARGFGSYLSGNNCSVDRGLGMVEITVTASLEVFIDNFGGKCFEFARLGGDV